MFVPLPHPFTALVHMAAGRAWLRAGWVGLLVLACMPPAQAALSEPPSAAASTPATTPSQTSKPAKIFKYMSDGTASFSDIPPAKGPYIVYTAGCFACNLHSTINWHSTPLHLGDYGDSIQDAALQFRVDPALVRAVIHAESGFNARARSNKGAMGLMQLMPATARDMGVPNALDPGHNIRGGARYLAGLLTLFHGDISLAAAAYNAGPGAVQKYAGIPPYAETQVYVQRVQILLKRYQGALAR